MIRRAGLFISACAFIAADAWADDAAPLEGGVVSTGLCADAYVLALVPQADIRALSWQVDHPVSVAPDWARELPVASASAEALLRLQPSLAVFSPGEGQRAKRMLEQAGYGVAALVWGEDFTSVRANLLGLGQASGRVAQAQALVADLDARLERLNRRAENRSARPRIAYLSASGGSAGQGTYVDAAITAAGGNNVMAEAGASGWTRSDPELALGLEADILLTSFFTDGYAGRLSRAQYHSAYQRLIDSPVRVDIPSGDWPCAGPRLIEAAEAIADAIDRWEATP